MKFWTIACKAVRILTKEECLRQDIGEPQVWENNYSKHTNGRDIPHQSLIKSLVYLALATRLDIVSAINYSSQLHRVALANGERGAAMS